MTQTYIMSLGVILQKRQHMFKLPGNDSICTNEQGIRSYVQMNKSICTIEGRSKNMRTCGVKKFLIYFRHSKNVGITAYVQTTREWQHIYKWTIVYVQLRNREGNEDWGGENLPTPCIVKMYLFIITLYFSIHILNFLKDRQFYQNSVYCTHIYCFAEDEKLILIYFTHKM